MAEQRGAGVLAAVGPRTSLHRPVLRAELERNPASLLHDLRRRRDQLRQLDLRRL
jgi:hypothetical protein